MGCLVLASCTVHGLIYEAVLVVGFSTVQCSFDPDAEGWHCSGVWSGFLAGDDCLFVESNLVFYFEIANFGWCGECCHGWRSSTMMNMPLRLQNRFGKKAKTFHRVTENEKNNPRQIVQGYRKWEKYNPKTSNVDYWCGVWSSLTIRGNR